MRYLEISLITVLSSGFSAPAVSQTAYGSCPLTAQEYQDLYERGGRVEHMVCMQHALERELSGVGSREPIPISPPLPQALEAGENLSLTDLFCLGKPSDPQGCREEQDRAEAYLAQLSSDGNPDVSENRNLISLCSFWTTAGEPTGSMGIRDSNLIARCAAAGMQAASALYIKCVKRATGEEVDDHSLPQITDRQSGRIQECVDLGLPVSY